MERRRFLLLASAGVVGTTGGCSRGGPEAGSTTAATRTPAWTSAPASSSTPVPPGEDAKPFDLSVTTSGEGFTQRGTVRLARHRYAHLKLDPPDSFRIDGRVASGGPPFDFLVMRHRELENYASGDTFKYAVEASQLGVTEGTFDAAFPGGTYRLVFDNSDRGEAPAAAELTVDLEWRVTPSEG